MPTTLQAAFLFVFLFLPGYLFLTTYRQGAAAAKERRDLYVVAETITFSILLLAFGWPLGLDGVAHDIEKGSLLDRGTGGLYAIIAAILVTPLLLGAAIGQLVRLFYRLPWAWLQQLLPQPERSVWDKTWDHISSLSPAPVVRIKTKSGEDIIGVMSRGSLVASSKSVTPRDVYLTRQYVLQGDMLQPSGGGIYIEGSDILSVAYGTPSG